MTISQLYQIYIKNQSVTTDTRNIKLGDIFFALKGPNFNGNNFALKALENGAECVVVDEWHNDFENNSSIVKVDDVLTCLQNLAKHHRLQFNIPFIAITGSNGKTTTKELVSTVLSSQYKTYFTQGNLNNHIGIPLTILSIKKDAEMAVIEMGANHQKEIEGYCKYALPTHGIITNCGKAHLEGFGGEEGVRKGKGELFDYLRQTEGTAFIYKDYDYLQTMAKDIANIYSYGTHNADVVGNLVASEPFIEISISNSTLLSSIHSNLVGGYNLPNLLCAVAIGKYFAIDEEKIKQSIESYLPSNSRSQMIEKGTNKIILDAYNANPSSMKLAIENFVNLKAENKVLMLGGMMELGEQSLLEHEQIIQQIQKNNWKHVVLVGGDFGRIKHPFTYFQNSIEAKDWFTNQKFEHSTFLIKGSRSMKMEKILEY